MAGIKLPIIASAELGDFLKVEQRMRDMAGQARKTSGSFGKLGGALKAAVGIGAVIAVGKKALQEAQQAYQVNALTNTVIKNTGAAAWTTSQQVGALATNLSNLTGVDDELVQAGSNVLLSFGNIRNAGTGAAAVFDRASTAAVDMGKALGKDPAVAAKMLGKALADPAKGMTALRKAGVMLTASQQAQIETMQKRGDLLGAQQVILGAVESKYKGAAAAMASPMERLQTTLNNLLETVGTPILDALGPMLTALQPLFDALNPILAELGQSLAPIIALIGPILATSIQMVMPTIRAILPIFGALGQLLNALLPILTSLTPLIRIVANVLSAALMVSIRGLVALIYGLVKGFESLVLVMSHLPGVGKKFDGALAGIRGTTSALHDILTSPMLPEAAAPVVAAATNYSASASQLFAGAKATVAAGREFAKSAGQRTRRAAARPKTKVARPTTGAGNQSFTVAGSGGGISLSVTVNGSIMQERDVARTIRDELLQFGRRQGVNVALGV